MKKICLILLVTFFAQSLYADFIIETKKGKIYKVASYEIRKKTLFLKDKKIKKSFPLNKIKRIKNTDEDREKRHRVIILLDGTYCEGYIVYQDKKKIVLNVGDSLKIFLNEDIKEIVGYKEFTYEINKSNWSAIWRSALIPGWGQDYTHNRFWSSVFWFSSSIIATGITVYFDSRAKMFYNKYEKSYYLNMKNYSSHKRNVNNTKVGASILLTLYLLNITDAFIHFEVKYNEIPLQQEINKVGYFSIQYRF